MEVAQASAALFDAIALWEIETGAGPEGVISAAVDGLVAGLDSPSLRELAGLSAKDLYWTVHSLAEATLGELGLHLPEPGSDEFQIAAARAMSGRFLEGALTPREYASWAHRTIGHEGAARLQAIVELDDMYDAAEWTGDSLTELDAEARSEADSLLDGEPLQDQSILDCSPEC